MFTEHCNRVNHTMPCEWKWLLPSGAVRTCPQELQPYPRSQGKACAMSIFTCQTVLLLAVPSGRLLTGHRSSPGSRTPWLCYWQVAETWRAAAFPLHSTSGSGRKTLVGLMFPEGRRKQQPRHNTSN